MTGKNRRMVVWKFISASIPDIIHPVTFLLQKYHKNLKIQISTLNSHMFQYPILTHNLRKTYGLQVLIYFAFHFIYSVDGGYGFHDCFEFRIRVDAKRDFHSGYVIFAMRLITCHIEMQTI